MPRKPCTPWTEPCSTFVCPLKTKFSSNFTFHCPRQTSQESLPSLQSCIALRSCSWSLRYLPDWQDQAGIWIARFGERGRLSNRIRWGHRALWSSRLCQILLGLPKWWLWWVLPKGKLLKPIRTQRGMLAWNLRICLSGSKRTSSSKDRFRACPEAPCEVLRSKKGMKSSIWC